MQEHESLLIRMYTALAVHFPDEQELFTTLADEERGHQEMVEALLDALEEGAVLLDGTKFGSYAIQAGISPLQEVVNNAEAVNGVW
jgi:rubrerythrin